MGGGQLHCDFIMEYCGIRMADFCIFHSSELYTDEEERPFIDTSDITFLIVVILSKPLRKIHP